MTLEISQEFQAGAANDVLRSAVLTELGGVCKPPLTAAMERMEPHPVRSPGVVAVFRRARSSAWPYITEVATAEVARYLWETCWCGRAASSHPAARKIVFEREVTFASEQYPNVAMTALDIPGATYAETEGAPFRGVFKLAVKRRVLFSAEVQFRTAELPRKKPKVWIDRRLFEAEDE